MGNNSLMDDLTQRYYEAEMRYLREAGKNLRRLTPTALRCLILINPATRSLCGAPVRGLRFFNGPPGEKLDDDLPELTEGLVSLLWLTTCEPSRHFPWLNCRQITGDEAERNAERFSGIVASCWRGRTRCVYSATRDITLHPLALRTCHCNMNRTDVRLSVCALKRPAGW